MKRSLGDQVALYMADRGLNSRAMARLVGTSRQNIEGVTLRGRVPRAYLPRLAAAMGTSVDDLLAGVGYPSKEHSGSVTFSSTVGQDVAENANATQQQPIPTEMSYSSDNLQSSILLLGSLLGQLDQRSRRIIGELLKDLAETPDEAEDIANKASVLATTVPRPRAHSLRNPSERRH